MRAPLVLRLGLVLAAGGAACGPVARPIGSLDAPPPAVPVTPPPQIPSIPAVWNCFSPTATYCSGPTATCCFRDQGVAADPAPLFAVPADPAVDAQPVLVYPLPGSVHPINLSDITLQWRRAAGGAQALFRIRVGRAGAGTYEFYVPCNHVPDLQRPLPDECVYQMPAGDWLEVAGANAAADVTIEVSGLDAGRGVVATAPPLTISFSPSDVGGGFYYWSTSLLGTYRLLFGAPKATGFITPMTPANPTGCAGCHVVSRNGAVIAFTAGDVADSGFLRATTTADPTRPLFGPSGMHDSATIAASPDGAHLLVSFDNRLVLREAATGAVLTEVDPALLGSGLHGYHPEWSPDGGRIAVTLSSSPVKDWSVTTGSIAVIPYQGGRFGPAQVVAPDDQVDFNFYPTWSPDGRWIAFASARQGLVSYDQALARLRLVAANGGRIYDLTNATYQPGHTSTWPKFAPHMQANGNVMFITFNSRIDYGFFLKDNAVAGGAPQLWLAALDLRKLPGADPSSAPVWLPFQEVTQHNHLGFWTTQVGCRVETNGNTNGCGEGAECHDGTCQIVVP